MAASCSLICHRFTEKDAFVGYQKDVAAAVVFQASSQLRKTCDRLREPVDYFTDRHHLWQSAWEHGLLGKGPLMEVAHNKEGSDPWKRGVCYTSLLWCYNYDPCSVWVIIGVYTKKDAYINFK